MSDFRAIGPLYCETPLTLSEGVFGTLASFPMEPINVVTSIFPALAGVYLFWYISKKGSLPNVFVWLAVITLLLGLGSTFWHGMRTEVALYIDWVSAFVSFSLFMFMWARYLKNRWWGYMTLAAIFGGTLLFWSVVASVVESNGPPVSLFVVVATVAIALVFLTWQQHKDLLWTGVIVVLLAAAAAVARTIDLDTCGSLFHFGTHAIWHVSLGLSALLGTFLVVRLYERKQLGIDND